MTRGSDPARSTGYIEVLQYLPKHYIFHIILKNRVIIIIIILIILILIVMGA